MRRELITPCLKPYSSPVLPVPKTDEKLRLVRENRNLNEQAIKSCWPVPAIEDFFDTFQGSSYFTKLEMSWRFSQLPIEPTSQNYTIFSLFCGTTNCLRVPI